MSKNIRQYILTFTGIIFSIIFTTTSYAVTLPWSTTYNCSSWTQGQSLNCDGMSTYGAWLCSNGDGTSAYEQITASANNPSGAGGSGQRHWMGNGSNNNSGSIVIPFDTPQKELWIRWYMKYPKGFKWTHLYYDKILYIWTATPNVAVIPMWYGFNEYTVYAQAAGGHYKCPTCGWTNVMGSTVGDGQWHYYELHLKMDTNGSNGVAEAWIDGIQVVSTNNAYLGTNAGWVNIVVGENQRDPANGTCSYVDYDDIKVSTTGYTGPISDLVAPAAPTNPH